MYDLIKKVAEDIYSFRKNIEEKALELRERREELFFEDMVEEDIIKPVEKIEGFSLKIGAVDSGVYMKEMHGFSLVLIRVLGTIFEYKNGYLENSYNHPSFPKQRIFTFNEEEVEAVRKKNLIRLEEEIGMAIEMLDKELDVLMLDGSLLPLLSDRPKETSEMFGDFERVCYLYQKLMEKAMKKNVLLLGIIKDARSKKIIKRLNINSGVDTYFLDFFLRKGERTACFKHTKEDQMLNRLIPRSRDVLVFYLKASSNDRPIRVEFLPSTYSFDEVANLVYTLTSISENFAYPSILLEVDKRVAIKKEEAESIEKLLSFYSNLSFSPLRRNIRPFKR